MDSGNEATRSGKKPYEKPRIVRVLLKPEEAVLGFCKNALKRGPAHGRCSIPSNCSTLGS